MKNKFEIELKVGDIVNYHSIIGEKITSKGHKIINLGVVGTKTNVAWITNKSGCVSIDALTKSEELPGAWFKFNIELEDGIYELNNAKVIIKMGNIVRIDNGEFNKIN